MPIPWTLPFDLLDHVIDDMAVLVLRTEHDNFRVRVDLDDVNHCIRLSD